MFHKPLAGSLFDALQNCNMLLAKLMSAQPEHDLLLFFPLLSQVGIIGLLLDFSQFVMSGLRDLM